MIKIFKIIEKIFGTTDIELTPMDNALTNSVFLACHENKRYIIRINNNLLSIDQRKNELKVIRQLEEINIFPKIVYANIHEGILITEYIKAEHVLKKDSHLKLAQIFKIEVSEIFTLEDSDWS